MESNTPATQNTTDAEKKSGLSMGMIAFGLIVLVAIGALGYKMMGTTATDTQTTMTQETQLDLSATDTPTTMQAVSYVDGVYDVKGEYTSPAGPETINVKLTLKDSIVTDVEMTPEATNDKSKFMQAAFEKGYKEFVIGKNINDISLEKVSGSSLTPMGFNDALEKIKVQAKMS